MGRTPTVWGLTDEERARREAPPVPMTDLSELLALWRREAETDLKYAAHEDDARRTIALIKGMEKLREQRDRGVYNGAHFHPGITEKVIIGSFDAEIMLEMEKPK